MQIPDFILPQSVAQAREIQHELRSRLILEDQFQEIRYIAGVDVGYDMANNLAHASIAVLSYPELKLVEQVEAFAPADFPYIPGLLAFREIPALLQALALLRVQPELLMVDGHGISHPRRMGIAAHLGVVTDMPAIGVAKSRLTGKYTEPGPCKGDCSLLMDKEERIGTVLRSRDNVNPLFIAPGHKISHESAVNITLRCLTRYRLPEPTRLADKLSKCKPSQQPQTQLL